MACDGTIYFAVQEFLNGRTNLAVGSLRAPALGGAFEDCGHTCEQLRSGWPAPIADFSADHSTLGLLSNRHHGLGHEHMENAGQGEQLLDEGRAGCPLLAVEKERATRMHRPADRELARVGIGL